MKVSDEVRFYFGFMLVNSEGATIQPFEHTSKKSVLRSQHEKLVKEELQRAKALAGDFPPWVVSQRPDSAVCLNDPVLKVVGEGNKKGSARRSRRAFRF